MRNTSSRSPSCSVWGSSRGTSRRDCAPRRTSPPRHLDTLAALTAMALERVHYVEVAQAALVRMESERLRHALLAALSHDLRTPVAAMAGLAESLALTPPGLSPPQLETARTIAD